MSDVPLIGDRQYRLNDGEFSFMVDCYGGDTLQIETSKGWVLFSWSDQFGPLPENKNGSVRDLPDNHPFWKTVSFWCVQGKRLDHGNHAVWHWPKSPVTRHLSGRHWEVIEPGEEGWDW